MPPYVLKAVCGVDDTVAPEKLVKVLSELRWISYEGNRLTVLGFYDVNASLAKNWGNGSQPKRKKVEGDGKPPPSQEQANSNPDLYPGAAGDKPEASQGGGDGGIVDGGIEGWKKEGVSEVPDAPTPTHIDQVLLYAKAQGIRQDSTRKFHAHYTARGWLMGQAQTPCKSWQAALREWALGDGWPGPGKTPVKGPNYERKLTGGYEVAMPPEPVPDGKPRGPDGK